MPNTPDPRYRPDPRYTGFDPRYEPDPRYPAATPRPSGDPEYRWKSPVTPDSYLERSSAEAWKNMAERGEMHRAHDIRMRAEAPPIPPPAYSPPARPAAQPTSPSRSADKAATMREVRRISADAGAAIRSDPAAVKRTADAYWQQAKASGMPDADLKKVKAWGTMAYIALGLESAKSAAGDTRPTGLSKILTEGLAKEPHPDVP